MKTPIQYPIECLLFTEPREETPEEEIHGHASFEWIITQLFSPLKIMAWSIWTSQIELEHLIGINISSGKIITRLFYKISARDNMINWFKKCVIYLIYRSSSRYKSINACWNKNRTDLSDQIIECESNEWSIVI